MKRKGFQTKSLSDRKWRYDSDYVSDHKTSQHGQEICCSTIDTHDIKHCKNTIHQDLLYRQQHHHLCYKTDQISQKYKHLTI